MTKQSPSSLLCPSAQPDMPGAAAFGIVLGTKAAPRVAYLKRDARIPTAALDELGDEAATRILRFSARCEERRCAQFSGGRCSLGQRIVEGLLPVADAPPPCRIRDACRWHAEEGTAACLRCPQVVTRVSDDQPRLASIAPPPDETRTAPEPP